MGVWPGLTSGVCTAGEPRRAGLELSHPAHLSGLLGDMFGGCLFFHAGAVQQPRSLRPDGALGSMVVKLGLCLISTPLGVLGGSERTYD